MAATAAVGLAGPARAQAPTWSAPQQVAVERGSQFSSLRLAVGPDGRGLLVWATRRPDYAIRAVDVAADGRIGRPIRVSPRGDRASGPQVGVARNGEAIVAWRSGRPRNRTVRAALRAPGGTAFGPAVRLSPIAGRSLLTGLDVGPDGTAVAAWVRRTSGGWRVEIAERPPGGRFGTASTVSGRGAGAAHVAIGDDLSRIVVWDRRSATRRLLVEAITAAPGEPFAARRRLSGAGDAFVPRLAIGTTGGAVISWAEIAGAGQRLQAVTRATAAAAFGPATTVAEATGPRSGFSEAEVASTAGRAYATWTDFGDDPPSVRVARTDAAGVWGPGERLSAASSAAFSPEVGAGGDRAVVVWNDTPQEGNRSGHLAASVSDGTGPWSAAQTISDPALIMQSGTSPRVAVAPDGTALAAYVDYGFGGSGRGQLSVVRLAAR